MRISYRAICLLALLILAAPLAALPATAGAQSAGDEQYVDPFQDDGNGNGNDNGNGGNSGSGTESDQGGSNSSAPSDDQSGSGSAADTTAAAQDPGDSDAKLPHTGGGVPEGWIVAAGVVLLLGGGFALRRVWPRPG